jgi:branched-chain amino acid transport system substrate-binding protein
MRRWIGGVTGALLLALAAGCGSDDGVAEVAIQGDTLTVYSGMPLTGPLGEVARDVRRGQEVALSEAGGMAGAFKVSLDVVDSADPETGSWTPGRVAAAAREAISDRQTVAYLGEVEHGASALSVPITNAGGIVHVSPRDTFAGLLTGGATGEPDRFYPSGARTFDRLVPGDEEQAALLARELRDGGARRVVLADDRDPGGSSLGDRLARRLEQAGTEVVDRMRLDADGDPPASIGRAVRALDADAFVYLGAYRPFAVRILRTVAADAPRARLVGTDALALGPDLPRQVAPFARRLTLTAVVGPAGGLDAFRARHREAFGTDPGPQAVFGYRSMRLVLEGIRRAGAGATSRRTVVRTTLEAARDLRRGRFAAFRVRGGRLVPAGR